MSKNTLRTSILILGLITGVIHAIILNILGFDWLMLLNGLGYFVLTWAVYFNPSFIAGQRKLVHYLFMTYTIITFISFFILNDTYGPLGIIAKVDEIFLLITLWMQKDK